VQKNYRVAFYAQNSPASIYNVEKIFRGQSPGPPTRREGDGGRVKRKGREGGNRKGRVVPQLSRRGCAYDENRILKISGPPNWTSPLQKEENRLIMIIYILYYS
jgi:hypothetical protein